ncbi:30S ribosome-binding factor RbfA [Parenemella sanctibonifatiensis]|nr:30S ribosome-binding factor RbfA [Parenemella sanctibonifatiensis]
MPSPRVLKLADQIKVIVAQMLERRVKDPRLGFVTITDVQLTGDTRDAKVFYTVLGDDADLAGTAAALESAKGLIRSQVGKQLKLRFAPTLTFVPDQVPETARELEELLVRVRTSDAEVAERSAGATYAGEADPYRKPREEEPDEADFSNEADDDDVESDDEDARG